MHLYFLNANSYFSEIHCSKMNTFFSRDRISVVLLPCIFIITVVYYTIFVFGENFDDEFLQPFDATESTTATKDATNWNWTLFAKHIPYSDHNSSRWEQGENNADLNLILEDVRRNFIAGKYKNVINNLRFAENLDNIACPIMISNSTEEKVRAFPDAIGIGFAKSGTGSLAMLRHVSLSSPGFIRSS